jgi:hypothetical protein
LGFSDDEENPDSNIAPTQGPMPFWIRCQLPELLDAVSGDTTFGCGILSDLATADGFVPFADFASLVSATKAAAATKVNTVASTSIPENRLVLLNLLYAPNRTRLFSLARTLVRIENLGFILGWTKPEDMQAALQRKKQDAADVMTGCPVIDLIELPRLKLTFTSKPDHTGTLRLYSVDHADLFISNERSPLTSKMLEGIPHSLFLSNLQHEIQVIVPVVSPARPLVMNQPFSTRLVLDRADENKLRWNDRLTQKFFLYPVHVSLSFMLTRGVNSALYLMLLRFLHRDYEQCFRIADSIATDTKFTKEGLNMLKAFEFGDDDRHPDAISCRLKISLVRKLPWLDCRTEALRALTSQRFSWRCAGDDGCEHESSMGPHRTGCLAYCQAESCFRQLQVKDRPVLFHHHSIARSAPNRSYGVAGCRPKKNCSCSSLSRLSSMKSPPDTIRRSIQYTT